MEAITFINTYGSAVEIVTSLVAIVTTIYVFFSDPIRRWRFFGYRPTVIIVLFDPKIKKVLLLEHSKHPDWAFPQGGIYGSDFYTTVEQTLLRELGISPNEYTLRNVKPMGTAQRLDNWGPNRASLGTFSFRRDLIGKGYLACFVETNLPKLIRQSKLGYGFQKTTVATITQAEKLINSDGLSAQKKKIHRRCLTEVEKLIS